MFNFKKSISYVSILLLFMCPLHLQASLTVICGSMCGGKSDVFICKCSLRALSTPDKIGIFKHSWDNRDLLNNGKDPLSTVSSRRGSSIRCMAVKNVAEMEAIVIENDYTTIGIDEAQFFDKNELLTFVCKMLDMKKDIIIAGLDLDFKAETFGAMGELLARADKIIKLNAICSACKEEKYCITQRIINGQPAHYNDPLIMVGGKEAYEPRCRKCHVIRRN